MHRSLSTVHSHSSLMVALLCRSRAWWNNTATEWAAAMRPVTRRIQRARWIQHWAIGVEDCLITKLIISRANSRDSWSSYYYRRPVGRGRLTAGQISRDCRRLSDMELRLCLMMRSHHPREVEMRENGTNLRIVDHNDWSPLEFREGLLSSVHWYEHQGALINPVHT